MKEQRTEIDAIANNPAAAHLREHHCGDGEIRPACSTACRSHSRRSPGANTNDTLDKVQSEMKPRNLRIIQDLINLNAKLFARVKAIYDNRDKPQSRSGISATPQDLLHAVHPFRRGSFRCGQGQAARDQQARCPTLETDFQQKLLKATKAGALVVDDKAGAGRPERCPKSPTRPRAAEGPKLKGKYVPGIAEHDAAAFAPVSLTNRDYKTETVRGFVDAHREGRRQRHARRDCRRLRNFAPTKRSCSASRTMRPTALRPDGRHARQGRKFHCSA